MASRRHNVVRVMLYVVEDLQDRGYPMAGVLRQLAREVAQLAFDEPADQDRCPCGGAIVQPRTGRPRKFCLKCSPQRKSAGKRDDPRDSPTDDKGAAA